MGKKRAEPWVAWYPEDVLGGTRLLEPRLELTYRRLLDFIALTNNRLRDDDKWLRTETKAGNRWKAHKQELIDLGKIQVIDGYIINGKMSAVLEARNQFREAQSQRGRSGNLKRWGNNTEETTDEN